MNEVGSNSSAGVVQRVESLRGRTGESTRHPVKERRGRCGGVVPKGDASLFEALLSEMFETWKQASSSTYGTGIYSWILPKGYRHKHSAG